MIITIEITKLVMLNIHLNFWKLIPAYEKSRSAAYDWKDFRWLCFTFRIKKEIPPVKKHEWSDDEVIRQIKNLEKEVETQNKKKTRINYKNSKKN